MGINSCLLNPFHPHKLTEPHAKNLPVAGCAVDVQMFCIEIIVMDCKSQLSYFSLIFQYNLLVRKIFVASLFIPLVLLYFLLYIFKVPVFCFISSITPIHNI